MSADELRARFSQLAEKVVPMEDPHGRLMSRRRKRFRARTASVATLTAAAVAGGLAAPTTLLNTAAAPGPQADVVKATTSLSRDEYIDRLIRAPLRGNLSGDTEMVTSVRKAFSGYEPKYQGKYQGARQPVLVFLNRTELMLQAVVIYLGGEQPIALARGASADGSAGDLVAGSADSSAPVTPFLVLPVSDTYGKVRSVVGLAPPGCSIESSAKGGFAADGTWMRTFEPEWTGDYVTRDARTVNELWRVSCDGKVREVRTADDYFDSVGVDQSATAMYERVVRFGGVLPAKPDVRWQGNLPEFKNRAVLIAPNPPPGPAMLVVGPFLKAILATEVREKGPVPQPTGKDREWSMIALGVAGEGVEVVRLPQAFGDRTVLSDQVFVYTESDAALVEAVDSSQKVVAKAEVSRGVAILTFSPGMVEAIRTVTARGAPIHTVRFAELATGSRLLGDQLFKDW